MGKMTSYGEPLWRYRLRLGIYWFGALLVALLVAGFVMNR
jgi:hypothetical protein